MMLHNLGESRTEFFDRFDMWNWVQEKKKAGLIKHIGFSFHSTPEELEAILTAHPEMEFVQLQINYADCQYCPKEIGISGSFTAMNCLTLYGDNKGMARHQENWLVGGHGRKRADECIKCGKCEAVCPQHIKIRENLEKVCENLLK